MNNKYIFVLALLLLTMQLSKGQVINTGQAVNKKVAERIETLQKQGIDSLVVYEPKCAGCEPNFILDGPCTTYEVAFLYWIKQGQYYLEKFDNCFYYQPISLNNSSILSILLDNLDKIAQEEIKPIQHVVRKKKDQGTLIERWAEHFEYTDFSVQLGTTSFKKSINHFNLETAKIDEKTPNDNYPINQQSLLKQLKESVEMEIKVLEKDNRLKKIE